MGSMMQAVCTCGYESEMMNLGFGFNSMIFDKNGIVGLDAYEPFYCEACKNVQEGSGLKKFNRCTNCKKKMVSYLEPLISDEMQLHSAREEKLLKQRWRCPSCKKNTLRFYECGLWD